MGLFTKKDPCAICGGKVTGLFTKKIDKKPVCKDCYGTVDLPDDVLDRMTVDDFRGYMAFRKENGQLRQRFHTTKQVDFGWFDDKFLFDMTNHLFCMDKNLEKTIFEGSQINSFLIREDTMPLFEGSANGLVRHTSHIPDRIMSMAPQIDMFRMQAQMYRDRELQNNGTGSRPDTFPPTFTLEGPFQNFYVEIYFDHPYWSHFTADMSAPTFDSNEPNVNDYLRHYNESAEIMMQLADALMELAFPQAPRHTVNAR